MRYGLIMSLTCFSHYWEVCDNAVRFDTRSNVPGLVEHVFQPLQHSLKVFSDLPVVLVDSIMPGLVEHVFHPLQHFLIVLSDVARIHVIVHLSIQSRDEEHLAGIELWPGILQLAEGVVLHCFPLVFRHLVPAVADEHGRGRVEHPRVLVLFVVHEDGMQKLQ